MNLPLYVSKPLLPDLETLVPQLKEIWASGIVTNNGPLHQKFENALEQYLGTPCAMAFNNGTIALLVALKMMDLDIGSEVITTPLTFAATAHSIAWNGLVPVFADVEPQSLTLDPKAVERAISPRTSAILAVHVYGNVCDVVGLQDIADKHGLRLIYDAAHVFGATIDDRPIGLFGDVSVFSFHATKLFNSLEGGAITSRLVSDKEKIYSLRNFGIKNEEEVVDIGINGKMNEFQAAVGLLNLPLVAEERSKRAQLRDRYNHSLRDLPGVRLPVTQKNVFNSEQYYHLVIDHREFGSSRDEIYDGLKESNIFARKYFHPICTDFAPYKNYKIHTTHESPYVNEVKSQVLCLPFHSGVKDEHIEAIERQFRRSLRAS